jgi:phytoene dehydrogenase-like protein
MGHSQQTDAIVIGAGLGGLLTAAHLLKLGKQVTILERLPRSGGRFTAKNLRGVQVSTGAVHMIPFGSRGVLSDMLRRLAVPHRFYDADVFGSFHVHGRQYHARGLLGICQFLSPRQIFWFLRVGYLMFFRRLPQHEHALPFDRWLARHIPVERNPQLIAFFRSIARFALSLELSQITTAEIVRVTKNMLRHGAPAIVQGGCAELTKQLEATITSLGGEIWLGCEVLHILHQNGQVAGVRVRHKADGTEETLVAPLVVSDIGPQATSALLNQQDSGLHRCHELPSLSMAMHGMSKCDVLPSEAIGLKVHILSNISLIPHTGILYCLDTKRIAGIVQPTNSDPSLAPDGKHLLISHQVIQSDNIAEERVLALADLRTVFGAAFDTHCHILTMGAYRGAWPVNRLAQGTDTTPQTGVDGLFLVGDAVKPSGYLMVEGVAQSVNCFLDQLLETDQHSKTWRTPHVPAAPCGLSLIRWLWQAPGNAGKMEGDVL